MSIWDQISNVAGYIAVGVVDSFQDLTMDPISGSMKAELIILARKSQGKSAPRGNGSSRAALRRRGLVEPYGDTLTRRGWNWYKLIEVNGDVTAFLRANDINPWQEECEKQPGDPKGSPVRQSDATARGKSEGAASKAKSIPQKSYYRWLYGCLLRMKAFEGEQEILPGEYSVWTIILEEELLALEELKPMLDMDDIRKTKGVALERESLAARFRHLKRVYSFDFAALDGMPGARKTGLRHGHAEDVGHLPYPLLKECDVQSFRQLCSVRLRAELRRSLPSLSKVPSE
jgi:hypothetical protein